MRRASRPGTGAKQGSPADWLTDDDRQRLTRKSWGVGLVIFAIHAGLYLFTMGLAVFPPALWVNVVGSIANGILIGMLFVVGHDASHGSYVPDRRANQVIARLAFLPSAHSASLWNVVHNRIHHGKTNLKGFDYVWAPMSKKEYDRVSPARRFLERIYRGPFGPLIYYYGAFWPRRVLLPIAQESRASWRSHLPDTLLVFAGLGATIGSILWLGRTFRPLAPGWQVVLLGWAIPFAVFNYIMALTTYVQHTHPRVPWFDDPAKWSNYEGNVRGSTHVELPVRVAPLWNMVLGHTAHHALGSIPIYHLSEAQAKLIKRYGGDVVTYLFTPAAYLSITRACKLYDFERMCWTDFEGVPTDITPMLTGVRRRRSLSAAANG
jgi:omega-6 fatty acid desaturase (delta-12 desaturase)